MSAEDKIRRKKAAMFALAQHWAGQMESYAKQNASWTDRTGHTRQAIHSGVEKHGDEVVMYLSHGMATGEYLESGTGLHGPHKQSYEIKPKNKKALFWFGAKHPVKKVIHPGIKAQPIIGPTVDLHWAKVKESVHELLRN